MDEHFSKLGKRGHTRTTRARRRSREGTEHHWSQESGSYRYRVKNAVAKFLRNLREHLHDVHSPG
jgi:hypothetical protein